CFFFFFQAEDGIRDGHVTGVQTCALPISTSSLARLRWSGRDVFYRSGTADPFVLYQVLLRSGKKAEYYVPRGLRPETILDIGSRSEERRVGKECRVRRSRESDKDKRRGMR